MQSLERTVKTVGHPAIPIGNQLLHRRVLVRLLLYFGGEDRFRLRTKKTLSPCATCTQTVSVSLKLVSVVAFRISLTPNETSGLAAAYPLGAMKAKGFSG
jgi:hypothetical protein